MQTQQAVDPRIIQLKNLVDEYERTGAPEVVARFGDVGWPSGALLPKGEFREVALQMMDVTEKKEGKQSFAYNLALTTLAFSEFHSGRYPESLAHYADAHKGFGYLNLPVEQAICSVVVGAIYRTMGDLELGLRYLMGVYDLLIDSKTYKIFEGFCAYQMAEIYSDLGHFDEALKYHHDTLRIMEHSDNPNLYARSLNGIGCVYLQQGNYPKALQFLTDSLEICERVKNVPLKARVLTDLGNYYYQLKNTDEALRYQQQALAIRRGQNIQNGSITNLVHLAEICIGQQKYSEAVEYLTEALKLAEGLHVKQKVFQIHLLLSDVYSAMGSVAEAFNHYKIYHAVKEEVHHEDVDNKVKNLKLVLEAEQTRKENEIIKKQNEEIIAERKESERLLLNILPAEVTEDLKRKGESPAKQFDMVTVLFTDFVDFTGVSEKLSPEQLVGELHACFSAFDEICSRCNIEKIKTVGDAYLAVSGLPVANETHARCRSEE